MRLDDVLVRLALAAVITLTTLFGATVVPAHAEEATYQDPARDTFPRWDLTRVHYEYGETGVEMKARVRRLRGGKHSQVVILSVSPVRSDVIFGAYTVRRKDGSRRTRLMRYDSDGVTRVSCDVRSRWALGKNYVTIWFNQGCMDSTRAVRMGLVIGAGDGRRGDPADWTDRSVRVGYTEARTTT